MGTYGKTFKIGDDAAGKGVGVSASGSGTSGKYTREGGFLSYYEVWSPGFFADRKKKGKNRK